MRQRVQVDVVLEPTGTYGDPLVHHLAAAGLDIYLVRADLAQQMRVLYDGNPSSHDAKSANHGRPQCAAEVKALGDLARDALDTYRKMKAAQKNLEEAASAGDAVTPLGEVVGMVPAAALVAALGDLRNYESPAAVVRALGLTLTERQSGQQRSRLRISKRGSSQARWYLFLAALRIIHRDAGCRAWHDSKRSRDGGSGLRSVVAIMRKLAKALWHVAADPCNDHTHADGLLNVLLCRSDVELPLTNTSAHAARL